MLGGDLSCSQVVLVPDYILGRTPGPSFLSSTAGAGNNDLMCCPVLTFWAPALQEERKEQREREKQEERRQKGAWSKVGRLDMIGENLVGFWGVEFCFSSLHAEVMNLNTG